MANNPDGKFVERRHLNLRHGLLDNYDKIKKDQIRNWCKIIVKTKSGSEYAFIGIGYGVLLILEDSVPAKKVNEKLIGTTIILLEDIELGKDLIFEFSDTPGEKRNFNTIEKISARGLNPEDSEPERSVLDEVFSFMEVIIGNINIYNQTIKKILNTDKVLQGKQIQKVLSDYMIKLCSEINSYHLLSAIELEKYVNAVNAWLISNNLHSEGEDDNIKKEKHSFVLGGIKYDFIINKDSNDQLVGLSLKEVYASKKEFIKENRRDATSYRRRYRYVATLSRYVGHESISDHN